MILSTEDKEKFMRFLEEDIFSNEGIMNVLIVKATPGSPFETLYRHKQTQVDACKIVHKILASMTTERIG